MSRRVLKVNDSAWLYAESHRTPMQVAMLATFAVPEDRPDFVRDLVARWREVREYQPPFNYLLKSAPVPSWKELAPEEIDLDYHFRHSALPRPGSQRELGVLVSRLHSWKMDRRYPLWECHIIEGIKDPDQPGDQWSMYMKVHHSQIDGVGGIRLLKRILSADPAARDMLPPWAVGTHGPDQSGLPAREPAAEPAPRESVSVRSIASAGSAVVGSLGRTYGESLVGSNEVGRAVPFRAPKTIFNGRIHTPRRFATQHYAVDRLKAVSAAIDGSLNDVFLGICGGALRRYLVDAGRLPDDPLIANVPVSVRPGDAPGVGNAITFLYSSLGTDIYDPVVRIKAIQESTRLGKERLPQVGGLAMDAYTAMLMGPFLSQAILGFGGRGRPASNVVISNVPGPNEPRYLDGSRLEEIYPVSLLFNGQALNITAVSYDGEFNIGFTGCRDSIPSLQKIAVHAGEELEALEQALGL
ncbi:wax ester/triacylglycerol synthase family O-acyltransferase [Nocardioides marmoriginsengisoli]|uniref:Diacylglycerol O-acyltransferase n=1 Tax=Nocardioides marmoriginsengisoli TaxID=661483 RepID=A0A3N0CT17_9ACTN|nr:wax ester/triacylglycerol synthase family O-acyltransferase [Nocardioides marmoriginsengisoli]RNL66136.1 wax ester/triacylglycerol synthase family O-acyltransferase [Nocardioides marmoriginsengisoli]